jgi:hypothetical protein
LHHVFGFRIISQQGPGQTNHLAVVLAEQPLHYISFEHIGFTFLRALFLGAFTNMTILAPCFFTETLVFLLFFHDFLEFGPKTYAKVQISPHIKEQILIFILLYHANDCS